MNTVEGLNLVLIALNQMMQMQLVLQKAAAEGRDISADELNAIRSAAVDSVNRLAVLGATP